jgi:hypothetical protein
VLVEEEMRRNILCYKSKEYLYEGKNCKEIMVEVSRMQNAEYQ